MIPGKITSQAATAVILGSLLLFIGCGEDSTDPVTPPVDNTGKIAPDFSLKDVNVNSSTHDQDVSPRDYLQKVSGWYFGSAT